MSGRLPMIYTEWKIRMRDCVERTAEGVESMLAVMYLDTEEEFLFRLLKRLEQRLRSVQKAQAERDALWALGEPLGGDEQAEIRW